MTDEPHSCTVQSPEENTEMKTYSLDFWGSDEPIGPIEVDENLEKQLTQDMLNIFMGVEGEYIKANMLSSPSSRRTFRMSWEVPTQLIQQVERLLPAAADFSDVSRFIEQNSRTAAGRVNQALSTAFSDELTGFMERALSLETEPCLNLSRLWTALQTDFITLNVMKQVSHYVMEENARGGATLSVLHGCISNSIADPDVQNLVIKWINTASVPFFQSLDTWLYKGKIYDPYDEFMITMNESSDVSFALNWQNKFQIRRESVPQFLEKVAEMILETGKCMFCLHMSSCVVDLPSKMGFFKYDRVNMSYMNDIKSSYEFANDLLKILLNYSNLTIRKLEFAKSLFCIEYGDFFFNLIEACGDDLEMPVDEGSQEYITSMITTAMAESSLRINGFTEDVEVILEKKSLKQQINDLLKGTSSKTFRNPQSLLEALSLTLKVPWPLKIFLDTHTIKCYQMIFRHIIYTRFIHMKLTKFKFKSSRKLHCLKYAMVIFLQTYLSFMTIDIVETSWEGFKIKYFTSEYVSDMIDEHKAYIYTVFTGCMLSSQETLESIHEIFNLCLQFIQSPQETLEEKFECSLETIIKVLISSSSPQWSSFGKMLMHTYRKTNQVQLFGVETQNLVKR